MYHCRVLTATETTIDHRWRYNLYDPFWRLYRNREHGAVLISAHGERPVAAGECLLLPAWTRFSTRCTGSVRHTYLHFEVIGLPGAWIRDHCAMAVLPTREDWNGLLDALPLHRESQWSLHLKIQAMLCAAVALAIDHVDSRASAVEAASSGEREAISPVVRWIESHLADPLPVEALAQRSGFSRDHFTRIFTRAMGSSPARHVAERRIAAAAVRLLRSDDPIEDIAAAVGFANRYHFSRVFHRILGITPAAYRRQGRA
ncbi:hypothetical protein LBMAG53_11360 [Planctomycetota bacterium]|nr:hypothetical protein LBMAG53_11360 [Planctomycetota bacterium]